MKTLKYFLGFIFISVLAFSCSSDDGEDSDLNEDGTKVEVLLKDCSIVGTRVASGSTSFDKTKTGKFTVYTNRISVTSDSYSIKDDYFVKPIKKISDMYQIKGKSGNVYSLYEDSGNGANSELEVYMSANEYYSFQTSRIYLD